MNDYNNPNNFIIPIVPMKLMDVMNDDIPIMIIPLIIWSMIIYDIFINDVLNGGYIVHPIVPGYSIIIDMINNS